MFLHAVLVSSVFWLENAMTLKDQMLNRGVLSYCDARKQCTVFFLTFLVTGVYLNREEQADF